MEDICIRECETNFLFSDADAAYPYYQLSSDFVKGNVVSVSASGLDNPAYLLIEANEDELRFEHINISDVMGQSSIISENNYFNSTLRRYHH